MGAAHLHFKRCWAMPHLKRSLAPSINGVSVGLAVLQQKHDRHEHSVGGCHVDCRPEIIVGHIWTVQSRGQFESSSLAGDV